MTDYHINQKGTSRREMSSETASSIPPSVPRERHYEGTCHAEAFRSLTCIMLYLVYSQKVKISRTFIQNIV